MNTGEIQNMLRGKVPEFARKVKPIYSLLEWEWGEDKVPTVEEIEEALYELIDGLKDDETRLGTGGLYIGIDKADGQASLSMVIDEFVYWNI